MSTFYCCLEKKQKSSLFHFIFKELSLILWFQLGSSNKVSKYQYKSLKTHLSLDKDSKIVLSMKTLSLFKLCHSLIFTVGEIMNSLQMMALIVKFWSDSIINLLTVWWQWPILLLWLSVWNKAQGMRSLSGWSAEHREAQVSIFLMKDIFVNMLGERDWSMRWWDETICVQVYRGGRNAGDWVTHASRPAQWQGHPLLPILFLEIWEFLKSLITNTCYPSQDSREM